MSYIQGQSAAPGTSSTNVEAASGKELQRLRTASALTNVMTFLRATAASRDFFEGYSLSEAIQERLDLIGGGSYVATQAPEGTPTLLAELDLLEASGLEAIATAREFEEVKEIPEYAREYDARLMGADADALIEQGSYA